MTRRVLTLAALAALVPLLGAYAVTLTAHETDLRPQWAALGLTPKSQQPRGTCSVFAVTGLLEWELASAAAATAAAAGAAGGPPLPRLSEEFVNWASHHGSGRRSDGSFFSDALVGLQLHGACTAALLPYAQAFDADLQPAPAALANAATRRAITGWWIKLWDVKTGMSETMLAQIRASLDHGHPVALGMRWPNQEQWEPGGWLAAPPPEGVFDGHSVILVGYHAEPAAPGGGWFWFRNSSGEGWREHGYAKLSYAYLAAYGNDAVGLRLAPPPPTPLRNPHVPGAIAAETLRAVGRHAATLTTQAMEPWGAEHWDGGAQLLVSTAEPTTITFALPVASDGLYALDLLATRAPDYGVVSVSVDGLELQPALDLYAAQVTPTGPLALGALPLHAGQHFLKLHVTGRNPAASGFAMGLDSLVLRPAPEALGEPTPAP